MLAWFNVGRMFGSPQGGTVAILAQGTDWAVAVTQAFFVRGGTGHQHKDTAHQHTWGLLGAQKGAPKTLIIYMNIYIEVVLSLIHI